VVDARKERIGENEAVALARTMRRVLVARGSKVVELDPKKAPREEIAASLMGPSGNLRAPALKVGTTLVVGFNEDLYDATFG
jgi:hypothetical protein